MTRPFGWALAAFAALTVALLVSWQRLQPSAASHDAERNATANALPGNGETAQPSATTPAHPTAPDAPATSAPANGTAANAPAAVNARAPSAPANPPSYAANPASAQQLPAGATPEPARALRDVQDLVNKGTIGAARALAEHYLRDLPDGPEARQIQSLTGVHPHP